MSNDQIHEVSEGKGDTDTGRESQSPTVVRGVATVQSVEDTHTHT